MNEVISTCQDSSLQSILSIIKRVLLLIQIIVPILLIIYGTISFMRLVKNPELKNGQKKIINQFLAAAIIFFIPVLVNVVMQMLGETTNFSSCWISANEKISKSSSYYDIDEKERKKIIHDANAYETEGTSLNYSHAVEVSNEALKNASHSDPSIVITSEEGVVLAERKPMLRREGASTTKVFAGYAALNLLNPETDVVTGTQFAVNVVGQWNGAPIGVGNKFSVPKAATYNFPGSSNTTATDIAVAIGRKYYSCSSDEDCFTKGMEKINEFYSEMNLADTHLGNTSGLDFTPKGHMRFYPNGLPRDGCADGHTANDLAIVTINAMQNEYFASGIKGRNNEGLFFIKSGTGYQCHGIWGFNYQGKRYYISQLGINCSDGDNKYQVVKDLHNWTITTLIK